MSALPAHLPQTVDGATAHIDGVTKPTSDDLKLMVSELVTNGIVHGRQENEIPVMLDLSVNGDIRCAVMDDGPGFFAGLAEVRGDRRQGWWLRLVEQLSDRWGMQCSSPRRTEVWSNAVADELLPRGLMPPRQLA